MLENKVSHFLSFIIEKCVRILYKIHPREKYDLFLELMSTCQRWYCESHNTRDTTKNSFTIRMTKAIILTSY